MTPRLRQVSNGEEIHGFLWQSTRLLAYETGTLDGARIDTPDADVAAQTMIGTPRRPAGAHPPAYGRPY